MKAKMLFGEPDDQQLNKDDLACSSTDDGMLQEAQIQWQFGDWLRLGKLNHEAVRKHPNKGILSLLSAAASLQQGNTEAAKGYLHTAYEGGCSKSLIAKILISGVHNTLGCAFAVDGQQSKASSHFGMAVRLSPMKLDAKLVEKARETQELARLGIPALGIFSSTPRKLDVEALLKQALAHSPESPALLIAAAESAQRLGQYQESIRLWQKLATVEGGQMTQSYYDRLEHAYVAVGGFPFGSPAEEVLRGDGDKHEILKKIHSLLQPDNYLEIGVQSGKSLALANCSAIGVDPMPQVKIKLASGTQLVKASSDEFFESYAEKMIKAPLELVFIDGMHLFEYVLRDFINSEKYSDAYTVVVVDDIFPAHPAQAERDRRTRAWTGDVWKLLVTLQQHRPDLKMLLLDVYPTGLLCITGLDRSNQNLQALYKKILESFSLDSSLPESVLTRQNSVSCDSEQLELFIEKVKVVRENTKKRIDGKK